MDASNNTIVASTLLGSIIVFIPLSRYVFFFFFFLGGVPAEGVRLHRSLFLNVLIFYTKWTNMHYTHNRHFEVQFKDAFLF
jgi:hypothetical protein